MVAFFCDYHHCFDYNCHGQKDLHDNQMFVTNIINGSAFRFSHFEIHFHRRQPDDRHQGGGHRQDGDHKVEVETHLSCNGSHELVPA